MEFHTQPHTWNEPHRRLGHDHLLGERAAHAYGTHPVARFDARDRFGPDFSDDAGHL